MDLSLPRPARRLAYALFAWTAALGPSAAQEMPFGDNAAANAASVVLQALLFGGRSNRDLSELDYMRSGYPLTDNNLYCALPPLERPVVIRTQAEYDAAVRSRRPTPDCATFDRGPRIDFSREALVGYRGTLPGCAIFGAKRSIDKSDRRRSVELRVEAPWVPSGGEPCDQESVSWLKVPAYPQNYALQVRFTSKAERRR
ncbi:MAG: hypothetical protein HY553_07150 [Elusimicrobia bacterium]|nr:hypothetical protein [Elusimicrobiota bacterium]